jgi:hypothetical protein
MTWVGHPSVNEILRVPGYLFWAPSALTSEATWGTKLGFCDGGIRLEILPQYVYHRTEEDGTQPSIKLYKGVFCKLYATMLNFNATALARLFCGLTSGTTIKVPGSINIGTDVNSDTYRDRLLFVPDDTNNPICVVQRACPNITQSFYFTRDNDTVFECVFDGFNKTTDADGTLYVGLKSGGTLR